MVASPPQTAPSSLQKTVVLCQVGMKFLIIENLIERHFTIPKLPVSIICTFHSQDVFIYSNFWFLNLSPFDILDWIKFFVVGGPFCALQDV